MFKQKINKGLAFKLAASFCLLLAASAVSAEMTSSGSYKIWADELSSGGGAATTAEQNQLFDTLGEAIISNASSTSYSTQQGFQKMTKESSITISLGTGNLSFGSLSTTQNNTVSHSLSIASTASGGFIISANGNTLSSAVSPIHSFNASSNKTTATPGLELFGMNISSTNYDSLISSNFNTAGSYALPSNATVIEANSPVSSADFTVNYVANVSSGAIAGTTKTPAGSYSTSITYTAVAKF